MGSLDYYFEFGHKLQSHVENLEIIHSWDYQSFFR